MADETLKVVKSEPLPELTVVKSEPISSNPSDSGAVGAALGASTVPSIARGAAEFATNPNVPAIGAKIGRVVGGLAPVFGGAAEYGLPGAAIGMAGAAKGAWAGGKTGWFTGKLAQGLASPLANALETLSPYAQMITTASGAQGVLDLAQMADATRKDIGTLGISLEKPRSQEEKDTHPALVNAVVDKVKELATSLKNNGVPAAEATAMKLISDGNAATFGRLMSLYMSTKLGGAK